MKVVVKDFSVIVCMAKPGSMVEKTVSGRALTAEKIILEMG